MSGHHALLGIPRAAGRDCALMASPCLAEDDMVPSIHTAGGRGFIHDEMDSELDRGPGSWHLKLPRWRRKRRKWAATLVCNKGLNVQVDIKPKYIAREVGEKSSYCATHAGREGPTRREADGQMQTGRTARLSFTLAS